jgi:hypothetical protein
MKEKESGAEKSRTPDLITLGLLYSFLFRRKMIPEKMISAFSGV